jgi:hypothetical protein
VVLVKNLLTFNSRIATVPVAGVWETG